MRHIALLGGVNVGGKNKLPMKDLTRIFTEAGCTEVRTYIQSGNVVFDAAPAHAKRLAARVETAISVEFGLRTPVVIRTAEELDLAIDRNPFPGEEEILHLVFLSSDPEPAAAESLDPNRSPGDRFILTGREAYLHLPNGVARTRLTNEWFDRNLRTTSTMRNWRTVLKLRELATTP